MIKFFLNLCLVATLANFAKADCRDVTLDACDYGQNGPFETSKGLDELLCQKFCDQIYAGRCEFYIYDKAEVICQLFDYTPDDYVTGCSIVSGTPLPSLDDCSTQTDDQCSVRSLCIHQPLLDI